MVLVDSRPPQSSLTGASVSGVRRSDALGQSAANQQQTPLEVTMARQTFPSSAQVTPKPARAFELDWLRALSVLLLIYFHTARAFNLEPWHIQNDALSPGLDQFVRFLSLWQMPLLFVVAGAATYFALGTRSSGQYTGERFRRLLIPLIFGVLVLIPPQVYVERISTWVTTRQSPIDFHGSFVEFYPHVFTSPYPEGNLSWHHLWFLIYLFVYSLAALPLFLLLRRPIGQRLGNRLATSLARGPAVLLLALPLGLIEVALRARFPETHDLISDWAAHAHYLLLFVYGYLLVAHPGLRNGLVQTRTLALGIGIVTWLVLALADVDILARRPIRAFSEWCWLVAILGYAQLYLNRPSRALGAATDLVMPFYLWHQTVIVVVAYFVVPWPVGIAVKFLTISSASLVLTLLLSLLVQRTRITRVLFGMRAAPREHRAGRRPSHDGTPAAAPGHPAPTAPRGRVMPAVQPISPEPNQRTSPPARRS
jgi:surface polysaccharide O-acyltransferase-like enzyme